MIDFRAAHLIDYQNKRLAKRYRKLVDSVADQHVREAIAKGYHKLLSYKDEYEVARLLLDSRQKAEAEFDGDFKMTFHLAPPTLGTKGDNGRPAKKAFGEWFLGPLKVLAKLKGLRGTPLDIFGYTTERKMERALIRQYEKDMKEVLPSLTPETSDAIAALAALPLDIRGFGPVLVANEAKAAKRREELLAVIRDGGPQMKAAAE